MSREVGWTIKEIVAGNYRRLHGIDVRMDLLNLVAYLEKYGKFYQSNPQILTNSGERFVNGLLSAIAQFKDAIKKI